ncbi:MAG TPA: hypothetical protein VJ697_10235 [Nitrososphaeraceae archaeon]|nr:hypothetical protein [Nitrososphaeraceae archaeon]
MYEHGFYHPELKKWYCSYFMDEKEWMDIHDYLPNLVTNDKDSIETSKREQLI